MPKMIVQRPEVHIANIEVEANSAEEALKKVFNGEHNINTDEIVLEFSHTFRPDEQSWHVIDEKGERIEFDKSVNV